MAAYATRGLFPKSFVHGFNHYVLAYDNVITLGPNVAYHVS